MTSPVFAALLGPHFLEGQTPRTSSNPVEIPLLEDDAQAMSDLCRLLHHTPVPELASTEDLDRVVAFALAAHKWDCTEALSLQAQGIVFRALHDDSVFEDGRQLAWLAAVAYCFNDQQVFEVVVDNLVLNYAGSLLEVRNEMKDDILPAHFYRQCLCPRRNASQMHKH